MLNFQIIEGPDSFDRFQHLPGFRIVTQYLAGLRSGGNHFEWVESKDHTYLLLFLFDVSSYSLSSQLRVIFLKVLSTLSIQTLEQSGIVTFLVHQIYQELALTFKQSDVLSLFVGLIDQHNKTMQFLNDGNIRVFYQSSSETLQKKRGRFYLLRQKLQEQHLHLEPHSRLILLSDGFAGGFPNPWIHFRNRTETLFEFIKHSHGTPAKEVLLQLTSRIQSQWGSDQDLPDQDCTGIILDSYSHLFSAK